MTAIRTRTELAQSFGAREFRLGAEIGVADGRFSLELCQAIPDLDLICVDPWASYPGNARGGPASQHDENYQLAQQRLAPYRARLVRSTSLEAVEDVPLGSLDFVFIDGNHAFDWVMLDLIHWSRRVRSGGIVAGHDYYRFRGAGVIEAVNAYTQAHGIRDWSTTREREPSFWWVQL